MKGIVYNKFLEMVKEGYGYEMVDKILLKADIPSKGFYSEIGVYSHHEIVTLIVRLHKNTLMPILEIIEAFGEYLFCSLMLTYGHIFKNANDTFNLFFAIDTYIQDQIKKQYPNAEFPAFTIESPNDKQLVMYYSAEKSMGDLAVGLINGCLKYFNEDAELKRENLNKSGSKVKFVITKK